MQPHKIPVVLLGSEGVVGVVVQWAGQAVQHSVVAGWREAHTSIAVSLVPASGGDYLGGWVEVGSTQHSACAAASDGWPWPASAVRSVWQA
jgi:hypothetical protein